MRDSWVSITNGFYHEKWCCKWSEMWKQQRDTSWKIRVLYTLNLLCLDLDLKRPSVTICTCWAWLTWPTSHCVTKVKEKRATNSAFHWPKFILPSCNLYFSYLSKHKQASTLSLIPSIHVTAMFLAQEIKRAHWSCHLPSKNSSFPEGLTTLKLGSQT